MAKIVFETNTPLFKVQSEKWPGFDLTVRQSTVHVLVVRGFIHTKRVASMSLLTLRSSRVHNFSYLSHMGLKLHTQLNERCIYHVSKYCIVMLHHYYFFLVTHPVLCFKSSKTDVSIFHNFPPRNLVSNYSGSNINVLALTVFPSLQNQVSVYFVLYCIWKFWQTKRMNQAIAQLPTVLVGTDFFMGSGKSEFCTVSALGKNSRSRIITRRVRCGIFSQ